MMIVKADERILISANLSERLSTLVSRRLMTRRRYHLIEPVTDLFRQHQSRLKDVRNRSVNPAMDMTDD